MALESSKTTALGRSPGWAQAKPQTDNAPGSADAVCQYLSGLADEPCHHATVHHETSEGLELRCAYRFEVGAVLAVDMVDRASDRVLPTRFLEVKDVAEDSGHGWRLHCVSAATTMPRQRSNARGGWLSGMNRCVPSDGTRLPRSSSQRSYPFPFRRAVYASAGWPAFFVLLLYLANARPSESAAGLWEWNQIGFLLAFGAVFGIGTVTLCWLIEHAIRWVQRLLRLS
jgi:hypothetical protein